MVTSSEVVGSSAISTSGSPARAVAPTIRCRMPPLNMCGYACSRSAGRDTQAAQQVDRPPR